MNPFPRLLGWLPADSRWRMGRRLGLVWAVAFLIACYQWLSGAQSGRFDVALVYSYAISTSIWFLCDPLRIMMRHRYRIHTGPNYWADAPRIWVHMGLGVLLGYVAGTLIGDAYSGRSTWELLQISPQRFWAIWVSTVFVALGLTFYFNERGKAEELQRQATEARLKLLETQLEPHMLFNTLANLRVLIQTDPPRAVTMLDRLGDYLRATLRASRTDGGSGQHTLADEFARLRDYLELMSIRMGPRLRYHLLLPQTLSSTPVPPLLLQPLVENAIRHGLEPQPQGGEIGVTAAEDDGHLIIEVSDTGVGLPDPDGTHRPTGAGFGLSQVRERLENLPGRGQLDIDTASGLGTRIRLRVPLSVATTPAP